MLAPTEALVLFVALLLLGGIYLAGAVLAIRALDRRVPHWPAVTRWAVGACAAVYAPVWLPVWAVMRWIRGPKPKSILDIDRESARRTMLAVDNLTRPRTVEQQAELYRRWRDNPGVPPAGRFGFPTRPLRSPDRFR